MFESICVVGGPLILSSNAEVDTAESQLGIRFPCGYREYVTRFGEGVLGGSYIRIYPPLRIMHGPNNVLEWRNRIDEFWFWQNQNVLSREMALRAVIIGDTLDGDELVVHPSGPDRVFVLPHDRDAIFIVGNGLEEAIEWLCSLGALIEAFDERTFIPFKYDRQA